MTDGPPIKAIETHYAGCRFRSRAEARWAVFMDHLGIPWQYEPQGYNLGDGLLYLPDFLVYPDTDLAFWFEVKGTLPTVDELVKADALAKGTGIPAFVYFRPAEQPAPDLSTLTEVQFLDCEEERVWVDDWGWIAVPKGPPKWAVGIKPTAFHFNEIDRKPRSGHWWWTDCPHCGKAIIKLHGQVGWCPSLGDDLPESSEPLYPRFAHATARMLGAYRAARSARFEHGEQG